MRVFIAGASGALGHRLVPLALRAGHAVIGMTRSEERAGALRNAGAEAVVADALDRAAVMAAIEKAVPEVVVHQLTALSSFSNLRRFDKEFAATNRLRTEGTAHLIAAARSAGARRFIAQSFAGWPYARKGGPVKNEDDALDPHPAPQFQAALDAIRYLEGTVLAADGLDGIVLRYGAFYGPGTSLCEGGQYVDAVRRRRFPIVGAGSGLWSFVHIDDAAAATLLAIERAVPGVYNIVDDEPAAVAAWLPFLASAVGGKPPRHIPVWLGRLLIGDHGLAMMNEARGASNAKAKRELGWRPRYPSWRDGFREGSPIRGFDQIGAVSLRGAPRATKQSRPDDLSGPRLLRSARNDNWRVAAREALNTHARPAGMAAPRWTMCGGAPGDRPGAPGPRRPARRGCA
jgi:nucleoside-diphosphate-sugar epimerase